MFLAARIPERGLFQRGGYPPSPRSRPFSSSEAPPSPPSQDPSDTSARMRRPAYWLEAGQASQSLSRRVPVPLPPKIVSPARSASRASLASRMASRRTWSGSSPAASHSRSWTAYERRFMIGFWLSGACRVQRTGNAIMAANPTPLATFSPIERGSAFAMAVICDKGNSKVKPSWHSSGKCFGDWK